MFACFPIVLVCVGGLNNTRKLLRINGESYLPPTLRLHHLLPLSTRPPSPPPPPPPLSLSPSPFSVVKSHVSPCFCVFVLVCVCACVSVLACVLLCVLVVVEKFSAEPNANSKRQLIFEIKKLTTTSIKCIGGISTRLATWLMSAG